MCVEVLVEYPFFVFGQGWSSCCPDRTTQLFELSCAKLCVGDVCVSLTLRSLRNGSLTDSQALGTKLKMGSLSDLSHCVDPNVTNSTNPNPPGSNGSLLMKASTANRMEKLHVSGLGAGQTGGLVTSPSPEQSKRMFRGGPMLAGSGGAEVRQEPLKTDISALCSDPERPFVRKRRWSAPERDQTEKAEEEPPVTLPKPSFLPQEVKISIEGHSSAGGERFLKKRVDC